MSDIEKTTIGLVQMSPKETKVESLEYAVHQIIEASRRGAQIVCLPELFYSHYFPVNRKTEDFDVEPETLDGEVCQLLSKSAKQAEVVLIGGSFYESDGSNCFNTCPVFEADGKIKGFYRKIHIPNDPAYFEADYFEPGNTYKVFNTSQGKIAPMICFDQWMIEKTVPPVANLGAELIVYPTAIGNVDNIELLKPTENWNFMWRTVMQGSAIRNSIHVAAINRNSVEGNTHFWGDSGVIGPDGQYINSANGIEDTIVISEIDYKYGRELKELWGFYKAIRKKELFQEII